MTEPLNFKDFEAECNWCHKTFSYSGSTEYNVGEAYCSADCEQAYYDSTDDETVWSHRKRAEVAKNSQK